MFTMIGHVHDQILAHYGQADKAEVACGSGNSARRSTDIDAGETRAIVSTSFQLTSVLQLVGREVADWELAPRQKDALPILRDL